MRRKYKYKNAVIYVTNIDINIRNIHKATERFLNRVEKEKIQNGDNNTSRNFIKQ